jgi:hypothetical protein
MNEFENEFEIVRSHILLLATEWRFYNDLYNTDKSINLLNQSASYFFSKLQIILIDSIILKINKLVENKETGKNGSNKNLTIDYLLNEVNIDKIYNNKRNLLIRGYHGEENKFFISEHIMPFDKMNSICGLIKIKSWNTNKPTLQNKFNLLKEEFKKLGNYRNKNIAHIDMPTQLSNINYLPKDTYEIISKLLEETYMIMNEIEVYLKDTSTAYEHILMNNGVDSLKMNLMRSIRYKELLNSEEIDKYDFVKNSERIRHNK